MRLYYGRDFVDIIIDSTADVLNAAEMLITTHTPHIKLDALPIGCKVAARILHGGVSQVGKRLTIGPGIDGGSTISPSSYSPSLAPQRNSQKSKNADFMDVNNYSNTCQLLISKAYQKPSQLVTYRSVLEVILLSYDSAKGFEMFLREDLEFIGSIDANTEKKGDTLVTATAIRATATPTSLSTGNAEHYSKNSIFGNYAKNTQTKVLPSSKRTSEFQQPPAPNTPTFTSDYIEDEGVRSALIQRNYGLKADLDSSATRVSTSNASTTQQSSTRNKATRPNSMRPENESSSSKTVLNEEQGADLASNDMDTRGFVSVICEFNPPVITLVGSIEPAITQRLEQRIFDKCVAPTAQAHYYEQQYGFGAPPGGRYQAYMQNIANKVNTDEAPNPSEAPSPTRQTYQRSSANRPHFVDIHHDRTVRIQRLSLPHHHFNEIQQAALYIVVMDVMEECAKSGIGWKSTNYPSNSDEDFSLSHKHQRLAYPTPFYYKLIPFDGETSITHNIVKQTAINHSRAIRGPQGRFTDADLLSMEPYKHSCELLFIPTEL